MDITSIDRMSILSNISDIAFSVKERSDVVIVYSLCYIYRRYIVRFDLTCSETDCTLQDHFSEHNECCHELRVAVRQYLLKRLSCQSISAVLEYAPTEDDIQEGNCAAEIIHGALQISTMSHFRSSLKTKNLIFVYNSLLFLEIQFNIICQEEIYSKLFEILKVDDQHRDILDITLTILLLLSSWETFFTKIAAFEKHHVQLFIDKLTRDITDPAHVCLISGILVSFALVGSMFLKGQLHLSDLRNFRCDDDRVNGRIQFVCDVLT